MTVLGSGDDAVVAAWQRAIEVCGELRRMVAAPEGFEYRAFRTKIDELASHANAASSERFRLLTELAER